MRKLATLLLLACLIASALPSKSSAKSIAVEKPCPGLLALGTGSLGPKYAPGSLTQWANLLCEESSSDGAYLCVPECELVAYVQTSCPGAFMNTKIWLQIGSTADSLEGYVQATLISTVLGVVVYRAEGYSDCAGLYFGDEFDAPCPP